MVNQISLLINRYKSSAIVFCGVVGVSLLFTLSYYLNNEEQEAVYVQISDMIPAQFVMVPIELENHEAISGLISSHGVVDLYRDVENSHEPHKIAQAVRIIRSQNNRFMVLIPENQVAPFIREPTLFYAVVQNSMKNDSQVIPLPLKKKRHIIVGESVGLSE